MSSRGEFFWMAALSVPLWLVFEVYNLRLQNWRYVGLPEHWAVRTFGYLWSFATIWPCILETTQFLLATGGRKGAAALIPRPRWMTPLALVMVVLPVVVPQSAGSYLFGLVWIGFALFPSTPSLFEDRGRLTALLGAGVICGFLWEFWNFWATARWVYTFPIWQGLKVFEMPLPGYAGFPAFAAEVFVLYALATRRLRLPFYEVR
jgi:hypothetical protein